MTGIIKRTTKNYNLRIPIFDAPGWGREVERDFDIIDAMMFAISGFTNVVGVWNNGTQYSENDRVVDQGANTVWRCLVDHTSSATGTFEDERTNHPEYWAVVSTTVSNRGTWQPSSVYVYNDFVIHDNRVGVVVAQRYTSSSSFDQDIADSNIVVIIDLRTWLQQAETSANNSSASAAASASSATNSANSATASQTSATNSANSATASANSATAASGSATVATTKASEASTSASDAAASATAADASKTSAAASATAASGSAGAAATSASNASGSATSASNSATVATNAANLAEVARDFAYDWSSAPENTPVDDGTNTGYSAYHWAKKAELFAGGIVQTIVEGDGIDVDATDVRNPIVALNTATKASLALADSAAQDADLAAKANADLSNVTQSVARTKVGTGTMAYRNVTISTANPSGGADGDVWFKVT